MTVLPILLDELGYILKHGGAGRMELTNRFAAAHDGHVARLERPSVV
ncbi:hypothetical protein ACLESO_07660 [Pyxidicoccus sp. 3LG]